MPPPEPNPEPKPAPTPERSPEPKLSEKPSAPAPGPEDAGLISGVTPVSRALARGAVSLLGLLPVGLLRAIARGLGTLAYLLRIRLSVAMDNLRQAYPEQGEAEHRRIAHGAYQTMALALLDGILWQHVMPLSAVRFEGLDLLRDALAQGRGVLWATAHLGSWERGGMALLESGIPLHVVVRPLKGAFNEQIMNARLAAGAKLIPARGAIRGVLQALKANGVVMVLPDQALPAKGAVFVPFFGRPASTTPAVAVAALKANAPVFVGVTERTATGLTLRLAPLPFSPGGDLAKDVEALTAAITAALEVQIRRVPEQWLWLHRRWKVQPPPPEPAAPSA